MIITVKYPDCGKEFRIDVPAIDRYKTLAADLTSQLHAEKRKSLNRESESLEALKNLFGGFSK